MSICYKVVVKKTFRYSNVFSYNHLYQPECFYEKRYREVRTVHGFWVQVAANRRTAEYRITKVEGRNRCALTD